MDASVLWYCGVASEEASSPGRCLLMEAKMQMEGVNEG